MKSISATLITHNEEKNIREALESVRWVHEIIVVDSGSTDRTVEVCREFTDRIFHRAWTGYVDQKHHAVERAAHDWILSLDADERLSAPLQREIGDLMRMGPDSPGYRIPRLTFFMGRWIRHGDWYPDYQLRLFDRRRGRWQGNRVHESVSVDGQPGYLKGDILHYTYRSLSDYLIRLERYSTLAALDYHDRNRSVTGVNLLANPFLTFIKAYLLKKGFLDGVPGLMVASMGAISVYFKYAKLYELRMGRPATADKPSDSQS